MEFIGRKRELGVLNDELGAVERSGAGRFVLVRGRRRVGKSRLIEEFVGGAGKPHVFFTATAGRVPSAELRSFASAVAASGLEVPAGDVVPGTWDAALAMTTSAADRPYVVVVDEFPFLVRGSSEVEGAVQNVWDRVLSRHPVLLILVGSDFAVMEGLTSYERPLYGRPTRVLRVDPLNPAEVAELLDAPAVEALDDYLVVGGFPELVRSRADARRLEQYLADQLSDPTSPLLVAGERGLSAQFPADTPARQVLRAIGSDASAFGRISDRSGVPRPTLQRTLDVLVDARVVARETPLAAPPGRHRRYRIADPALRFWLRYLDRGLADIERERGDLVLARIERDWPDYRGRAMEPIARHALTRLLPDERLADVAMLGSWWTRTHDVEVDIVGVDDADHPRRVAVLGTMRWRDRRPLTRSDLAELHDRRIRVPGADDTTRFVAVSQTGETAAGFDAVFDADDLLAAYRR
ncbi:MAG TPA: ATP-binding protein [Euzebyales bacterium]|nr:ATP-binding protein [Euzebyales bacterium]